MAQSHQYATGDPRVSPARSWREVAEEFNRRHPDQPMQEGTAKALGHQALKKLRTAMDEEKNT